MGGGGSQQQSEASYPEEFRPLASSAVQRIQALQNMLPVENFAAFQPAGTAGIAPMQQMAMENLIPSTFLMPRGVEGLFALQNPVGWSAYGSAQAGAPTQGAQSALDMLSGRLGSSPQLRSTAGLEQGLVQSLPNVAAPSTAFPGISPQQSFAMAREAANRPVPILGGPGPSGVNTSQPLPASAIPPPFDMMQPGPAQVMAFFRNSLNGAEQGVFDQMVADGLAPEAAFNQIIGQRQPPAAPSDAAAYEARIAADMAHGGA